MASRPIAIGVLVDGGGGGVGMLLLRGGVFSRHVLMAGSPFAVEMLADASLCLNLFMPNAYLEREGLNVVHARVTSGNDSIAVVSL
eukprot:363384-Chlamydomonas_euryale.AAC.6